MNSNCIATYVIKKSPIFFKVHNFLIKEKITKLDCKILKVEILSIQVIR